MPRFKQCCMDIYYAKNSTSLLSLLQEYCQDFPKLTIYGINHEKNWKQVERFFNNPKHFVLNVIWIKRIRKSEYQGTITSISKTK